MSTENLHDASKGIDERPLQDIAAILSQAQTAAAHTVHAACGAISDGALLMAKTIQAGGALHYVAAGSSGLMAAADAQELGGTFSIPTAQLRIHMAGGLPTGADMPGDTEDDTETLNAELGKLQPNDTMIAVSASGSTPYTLAAAKIARDRSVPVVGIANNPGSPLLDCATCPILLDTPPEVLSGSTRMGAGTAQKIALNMLSTLMAVELGHIFDGMMVNLRADNIKLHDRASRIVQTVADVLEPKAAEALKAANGDVKSAILIAALNVTLDAARNRLAETKGHLRPALRRTT